MSEDRDRMYRYTINVFQRGFTMKVHISKIMALLLVADISTGVFAANGNRGDWGLILKML